MNRSKIPIIELERQLEQLSQSLSELPVLKATQKRSTPSYSVSVSGIISTFDDQLESLRLEANLLQSEDSPFTKGVAKKSKKRALKLAEARAFAEAQFERLAREKELAALKARRAEAEQQALLEKQAWERAQNQSQQSSALVTTPLCL